MEVTRSNFNEVLPLIEKSINNATFLSIDCELSGLNTVLDINSYDTIPQYYERVRRNVKDFLVIQYGITSFRYEEEHNMFKQQSYNFYIFRRPVNRNIPDQRFLCQSSSIDFLVSQDFDFNKLFKEGISYLNNVEETKYRELLEERQKVRANFTNNANNDSKIPIPDADKPFIDDIVKLLEDFIKDDEEEIQLPRCNGFLRRLIYQTASDKFQDKLNLETRQLENKDRVLIAGRCKTKKEKENDEKKKIEDELKEFEDSIAFSKVIRLIVNSGKLVIGHNVCLDLLHTIDKFLTPLPKEYEEFKDCAHSLLSNILDTKYMSSIEPFRDLIASNVLGHLLETVSEKPFEIPKIEIEEGGQSYTLMDKKEHEAGYDAFITGVSFLSMWKYLGSTKGVSNPETFQNFKLLRPYVNRIFLMRLQDNQFMHLGGKDPRPLRDHVFYITFPKHWKTNDIIQLFSPFGNVHVAWLDESSAYVGLHRKDLAAIVSKTLSQSDAYSIITYAHRQAQISGLQKSISSPRSVRKKRSLEEIQRDSKKRRLIEQGSASFSKRSIEPIYEEESDEDSSCDKMEETIFKTVSNSKDIKKRKTAKTFSEDDAWE